MRKYRIVEEGPLYIVEVKAPFCFIPFIYSWDFVASFSSVHSAIERVDLLRKKELQKKYRKVVWP